MAPDYDLVVIGGGINGTGIARDAVGRGASVLLAEMGDLAGATSSASTKLIHGGLRYLEYYEFDLVRKALKEREVLWRAAPHIVWPLRFILPHHKDLRPAWLLRLGLFLYDHLGGRKLLPATKTVKLDRAPFSEGLKSLFSKGFEYSDCWVEDARLVVLNARDAADRGAEILTRTKCYSARREGKLWRIDLRNLETGEESTVTASVLVNAAGPWVADMLSGVVGANRTSNVRLVKGSHIVVPRLYTHDRCFIFQNGDGRIIFAIPYETDFTLIGTTDVDYQSDPGEVTISNDEVSYLCKAVSEYFERAVTKDDVVHTYSGVRPLYDDGAEDAKAATRDYVLELEGGKESPALLSVFGGKITTYRKLAEHALEKVTPFLPFNKGIWTANAPLPGGDFDVLSFADQVSGLRDSYPFLGERFAKRLMHAYGTDSQHILGGAKSIADLGHHFGADLYEAEVKWLVDREWARTSDDIAWRRSKLGLRLTGSDLVKLDRYLSDYLAQKAGAAA
ncbi:homodimeric glycerol 3-phosphate dehydrogenase (quinone) [Roseibium hamelinense]|uniref:Glycerol-3-phosphate dehydrogenase n=1 Tax=Roseibium hamelinense TaxID=150831 RepID=A0A562SLL7_9HYPH|nr:glycerol-3-phosphate dehydrogenase [Roseibium hamelinense]MTI44924.1 glycerol-3-phosphate dehydrogenase [Roseibium hamelinense]TWI82185.1 homodimeric glycerol 3-phosphate dehydrogenase (quinone) [Roseibium hamelinense]